MKIYKTIVLLLAAAAAFLFWMALPEPSDYVFYVKNIIIAAIYIIVYLALGIKIQKLMKINDSKMKYPFAFALSTGFFGTLFFITGLTAGFNDVFVLAALIVPGLVCFIEIKEIYLDFTGMLKELIGKNTNLSHKILYIGGGFVLIYFIAAALTPPVYYDSLVYHLAVPEQYTQAGRVINMRQNIFSYFPQLMGMNYLFLMYLMPKAELIVKVFSLFMAIMALVAVSGLAVEMKADKRISVLLLLTCPLFFLNTARVGAELPLMFFTLLLIYMLVKALNSELKTGEALLAGLFAGMIMSVKYTGVLSFMFGAGLLIYCFIKKKLTVMNLVVYIITPALVVLPYLFRNWNFTGDPLYPFFSGLFNMDASLRADAAAYVSHVSGFGLPRTLPNFVNALIKVSADKEMLFGGDVLSPMYLLALAMIPLTNIKKTGMPAIFIGFYFITWFFTGQVLRFLIPIVPVAAVIAGCAYANSGSKLKYLAFGAVLVVQAEYSLFFGEKEIKPLQLIAIERGEYIFNNVPYMPAAYYINGHSQPGEAVLVIGDARTFYLERPALAYTVFNKNTILNDFDAAGEDVMMDRFRQLNIRFLLVNWKELERLKASGFENAFLAVNNPKFKSMTDKYFTKVFSYNECDVFEINEGK